MKSKWEQALDGELGSRMKRAARAVEQIGNADDFRIELLGMLLGAAVDHKRVQRERLDAALADFEATKRAREGDDVMWRETKLDRLRTLRRHVCYERASFSRISASTDELPASEAEVDEFIKKRTQLYRETWILPMIDELIEAEERKRERRKERSR